mmetsp:Transcript_67523/g.141136  ORF Transcript_67523/g.141136 Transcript_67523/m.141136 type:complete len:257 (+) Transcript_67523:408-1178(+)
MVPSLTRPPIRVPLFVSLSFFWASLALEESYVEADSLLATDDECRSGEEGPHDCAMSALQLKAKVSTEGEPIAAQVQIAEGDEDNATSSCAFRVFEGQNRGAEACFCHKSSNPGCTKLPCACREGCAGYRIQHRESISFHNYAKTQCPTAMLTLPRSFYKDISDLKNSCGGGAAGLLAAMLVDGFNSYHMSGGPLGPVMQCIHKPWQVSVHWLHLHTFCTWGTIDQMPNAQNAFCHVMNSVGEATTLANKFLSWDR